MTRKKIGDEVMGQTITFRLDDQSREKIVKAQSLLPYELTISSILRRGIDLALIEIEEMAKKNEVTE